MTISEPVRSLILDYMDSRGHTDENILIASDIFQCSVNSIRDFILLRNETGSSGRLHAFALTLSNAWNSYTSYIFKLLKGPIRARQGRKGWVGIPTADQEFLLDGLKMNPTMHFEEMADYLFLNGYCAYTGRQISRALKSRGITRRDIDVHVFGELNGPERDEFVRYAILFITS